MPKRNGKVWYKLQGRVERNKSPSLSPLPV